MTYQEFIESKKHLSQNFGIETNFLPDGLFDYQKYVTEYAIKKGRCAVFLDTGLGKTIIELTIAKNYIQHTNKPVLIITPLAVAFQFIKEAKKFDIDDIEYSKDGHYKSKIVVCNYERLDKFSPTFFDCVILDESSILKNFDGAIKTQVTAFLKKVKYRYLFTATPSPNDFIELGTSSEALGYLGFTDMLTRFFTNNEDTISMKYFAVHRDKEYFLAGTYAYGGNKYSDNDLLRLSFGCKTGYRLKYGAMASAIGYRTVNYPESPKDQYVASIAFSPLISYDLNKYFYVESGMTVTAFQTGDFKVNNSYFFSFGMRWQ